MNGVPIEGSGQQAGALPRGLIVLLTAAAGVIIVGGIKAFSAPIGPLMLALVIVVVVSPIQGALTRRGAPSWVALIALLLTSFGVLVVIVGSVVWAASELVGLITGDTYAEQLAATRADLADFAVELGVEGDDLREVLDQLDIGAVAGRVTSALSGVFGLLTTASLLMFAMMFMVLDAGKFDRNVKYVANQRPDIVASLRHFASTTRTYFLVSTIFGLIVAVLDVVALFALGIPLALVWGLLSLITNYIPNIGFVIGLIPPALLAFFEGGWQLSFWVIVAYTVINVVIQSIIQPKFVGDAVGLSATLTFISLIFWGWVLGPLGALLAVPITLLLKALLIDIDPTTRWASPLIALDNVESESESESKAET